MKIQVWLKSGNTFTFECEDITINTSKINGSVVSWEAKEVQVKNRPIYIDWNSVEAVTRVNA